jgi:uncharacterized protein (TIGR02145 family)
MNFRGCALLLTAMGAAGAVCLSYGEIPTELVGHWIYVGGSGKGPEKSVELLSNGTGTADGVGLAWKVENKRLVLSASGAGLSAGYKVSGHELVLTYYNQKSATFVKKGKLEEDMNKRFEKISGYFTDSRNGQKYRTVNIGGKTWMAQNLNYQTGKSWCYGDDNSNCEKYGRLYDWNTARTACPAGWRLPSRQNWGDLGSAAGGAAAGKALKSTYGWNNGGGTDDYGFSALSGGRRGTGGTFRNLGSDGYWWTVTGYGSGFAYRWRVHTGKSAVTEDLDDKSDGLSVRCLQD